MKILITADWHIGRKLYEENLKPDLDFFLNWLIDYIRNEQIDYLLVAGDVFDQANPANEAIRTYFSFLNNLNKTGCRAVITAGNHDSPTFLETPKELLESMQIRVLGNFPGLDQVDDIIIPLTNRNGQTVAALAAIPFLHDRYIRQIGESDTPREIKEKIREGMKTIMAGIGARVKELYPNTPSIGIAHLHAMGATPGDAERIIQIGNLDGIPANELDHFDYLALGHIHSGITIRKNKIKYTGSPIKLTFGEINYPHEITQLDIQGTSLNVTHFPIPQLREFHQISGTWDEITTAIGNIADGREDAPTLVEVEVKIPTADPGLRGRLDELSKSMTERNLDLTQAKITVINPIPHLEDAPGLQVSDLSPVSVFSDMIRHEEPEIQQAMLTVFQELFAQVTQNHE